MRDLARSVLTQRAREGLENYAELESEFAELFPIARHSRRRPQAMCESGRVWKILFPAKVSAFWWNHTFVWRPIRELSRSAKAKRTMRFWAIVSRQRMDPAAALAYDLAPLVTSDGERKLTSGDYLWCVRNRVRTDPGPRRFVAACSSPGSGATAALVNADWDLR
jgi:hypothetical protein